MPKRWRMPPENPASAFLRTSQRLTWCEQRLDRLARARLRCAMPFSTARWSSMS